LAPFPVHNGSGHVMGRRGYAEDIAPET